MVNKVKAWLNVETKSTRKDRLLPYLVLAVSVIGGFTLYARQGNDRAEGIERDAHQAAIVQAVDSYRDDLGDYSSCLTRVESRTDLAAALNGIYVDNISVAERFGAPDIAQAIREKQAIFNGGFQIGSAADCHQPVKPQILINEGIDI